MRKRSPRKTSLMKLIELEQGKPIEQILFDLYWTKKMTMVEVGREIGVDQGTVCKWMERFNIPVRGYEKQTATADVS